jgi:Zn-dependent alcohol dehydrogenase
LNMQTQPALIVSAVAGFFTAMGTVVAAFLVDPDQQAAVIGMGTAAAAMVTAVGPVIGKFVVSPATAADAVVMAKQDTTATNEVPKINMTSDAYNQAVKDAGFRPVPPPVG